MTILAYLSLCDKSGNRPFTWIAGISAAIHIETSSNGYAMSGNWYATKINSKEKATGIKNRCQVSKNRTDDEIW